MPDAAYTRPSAADQELGLAMYEEGVALRYRAHFWRNPAGSQPVGQKGGRRTVATAPLWTAAHRGSGRTQ